MKNRTLLSLLVAVGFVGATSCGDQNNNAAKDAEIAALRQELARRPITPAIAIAYTTAVQTSVVQQTLTNVGSGTQTSGSTVVYTITSTGSSTSTASSTTGSTSTNTAGRM